MIKLIEKNKKVSVVCLMKKQSFFLFIFIFIFIWNIKNESL